MERQAAVKAQKTPARTNHLQTQSARPASAAHPLLALQSSAGNQALHRLINSDYIQAKLRVSTPGDPSEREADHVADTVMRMPEPQAADKPVIQRAPLAVREDEEEEKIAPKLDTTLNRQEEEREESQEEVVDRKIEQDAPLQRQSKEDEEEETLQASPPVQRLCTSCEEVEHREKRPGDMVQRKAMPEQLSEDEEEEEREVQTKAAQSSTPKARTSVAANIHAMNGGGSPLPAQMREFFEPRFGADFSRVRVHTDSRAAETADSINAQAFTVGQNIAFGGGKYAPASQEGRRLLAHELTHVVQQNAARPFVGRTSRHAPEITASNTHIVHRDEKPDAGVKDAAPQQAAPVGQERQGISMAGNEGVMFEGILFQPDETQLRQTVEELMSKRGSDSAEKVLNRFEISVSYLSAERSDRSGVDAETELLDKFTARLGKIIPNLRATRAAIKRDREKFIKDFETLAKANVTATLTTSEETAKREAVRYGLTEEKIWKAMRGVSWQETRHHMQKGTPVATGLQKAAGVLLARRQKLDALATQVRGATRWERDPWEPKGRILVPDEPRYSQLVAQFETEKKSYEQLRSAVAGEYPVLAAVSELDKSSSELETISKKGGGDETAQIIGAQIADRLANIKKVRENLHDKSEVNVWRLPPVVEVTSVQLGAQADPLKQRWVSEQVEEEKPGILGAIALLIFNLLAIALAPVTGGISLAVAAGVNVVATGFEVKEFLMQKALAGTDFDKAKSLSQDEPSLFWLAVSIVGTVFDVAGAAAAIKTFRALGPLAKAAKAAKSAEEAELAIKALADAAEKAGGRKLAEKVVSNVRRARAGESLALEAAGATKLEREALEAAAKATDTEVANAIGAPVRTVAGEVKLSKAGHLFDCASPCAMFREKYASALAKDPALESELAQLEKRALDAAAEAQKGGPKAAELADAVKKDAAILEAKLRKAQFDIETGGLRSRFSQDELAAFDNQLAKARDIGDTDRRLAAIADLESQIATQKENAALFDELTKANPGKSPKEIAEMAKSRIQVPNAPHGMTTEEFLEAQSLIKKYLQDKGLTDVEAFATGSRVTGVTTNPKKGEAFGKAAADFTKKDLDITLVTSRKLTNSEIEGLKKLYQARFKHPLGIRNVFDRRQLAHLPVYGKIDFTLK